MMHGATCFEQCCLGTFPLRMGSKFLSGYLDRTSALCLTWLPTDGNIAQKVAPCIISLTDKVCLV